MEDKAAIKELLEDEENPYDNTVSFNISDICYWLVSCKLLNCGCNQNSFKT